MSNSKPHFDAEKLTGEQKNSAFFTPRNFSIIWGNDSRYWEIPEQANAATKPAKLKQVSWLEVTGVTNSLEPGKYEITFEIEMTGDAFGWQGCPLFMMAKVGKKGRYTWKRLTVPTSTGSRTELPSGPDKFLIDVPADSADQQEKQLYFGLYEVWTGRWKGGLLIHCAKVIKIS